MKYLMTIISQDWAWRKPKDKPFANSRCMKSGIPRQSCDKCEMTTTHGWFQDSLMAWALPHAFASLALSWPRLVFYSEVKSRTTSGLASQSLAVHLEIHNKPGNGKSRCLHCLYCRGDFLKWIPKSSWLWNNIKSYSSMTGWFLG